MLRNPGSTWSAAWNPQRLVTQHMDALDLRYEDGSFDGAFSASSIEHFGTHENVRRSLEEAFRVLRPGGVYAVSTEFRISGPGPGLPNTLIFDEEELRSIIDDSAPWEIVGPWGVTDHIAEPDPIISFEAAAAAVTAPTPLMRETGSARTKSATCSGAMVKQPSGLSQWAGLPGSWGS